MAKFSESPGTDLSYTIQPISKAAVTAGQARGGNILGIEMIEQTCELLEPHQVARSHNIPQGSTLLRNLHFRPMQNRLVKPLAI